MSDSIICVFMFSRLRRAILFFFFFNDTATTEIYTLSLHDALPILFEIVSQTHIGVVIDVVKFHILQVVYC